MSDRNAGTVTVGPYTLTTRSEISALAGGQLISQTIGGPGYIMGQVIPMTVVYSFGNVGSNQDVLIQPAGNQSHNGGCFRLIAVDVTAVPADLGHFSGITTSDDNDLYFAGVSSTGTDNFVTVVYSFLYLCAGTSSVLYPFADMGSGTQYKYTKNFPFCTSGANCTLPTGTNPYTIDKTVTPDHFFVGDSGSVMYKVVIHNSSTTSGGYLNRITDILPAGVTYQGLVTGTSCDASITNQVTAANSALTPAVGATGTINWIGNPVVFGPPITGQYYIGPNTDGAGPLGNLALCYNAIVSTVSPGTFTNRVNAYVAQDSTTSIGEDTTTVTVEASTPAIDIRKNAEGTDTQQILSGGTATFHIIVTNTGNLTLYNVAATDALTPDCDRIDPNLGTILPGESVEYDCTVTNVTLAFTNIAQVTADAPNEDRVTDEDPSTVTILVNPGNLVKQLISTNQGFTTGNKVTVGEIITYRVTTVIPPGRFPAMVMTDSMDRGLAFVSCSSITGSGLVTSIGTLNTVCINAVGATYLPGSLDPRDQGRQVVFDFGTLENPTQGDIPLTITYTVVVLNSIGNVNGVDLGNSANLTWGVGNSLGPVAAPDVEIVEPRLYVTKSANPTLITVGTEVTFTLTIAHDPVFSTTEGYNVILIDQLPVELGNVTGLDCITGSQDPATCIYSSTRTLRAEWPSFTRAGGNGVIIFRATVLSIPDSREITNSITGEWTSLPGDVSDPQSDFNDLSDERTFPPGISVDNYIDTDEIVLRPASQPSTGFAPGRLTVIDLPRGNVYAELGDLSLEIPTLGINIPIVGVPLVDQEWDLTWLWNKAGWLNETAYPTWNGNSVMTGHVYLPNGLPGPFLNLDKLVWGDQIIVHANGLRYIYQIRAVNTVKADDMSAFKHEEKSWVTLITCKEYNETTDTYKKRIVVQAVLVEVTKELGATQ